MEEFRDNDPRGFGGMFGELRDYLPELKFSPFALIEYLK